MIGGNCLLVGGIPGIMVDSMTGAGYTLKPEKIHVEFSEDGKQPQLIQPLTSELTRKQSDEEPLGLLILIGLTGVGLYLVFGT